MNTEALRQFLVESNKAGYAGGDEKEWRKEEDGSTTISYERDGWRLHDNFFGGEPYGGRIIVFCDARPVWLMVYYGWVTEDRDANLVYGVLRKALMQMPKEYPLRGPKECSYGEFTYTNSWHGDIDRFSGEEQIKQRDEIVYGASYLGGVVDQRSGV